MEERKQETRRDSEIYYSKAIRAGKRIYYLDVKQGLNKDLFLAITESKRRSVGELPDGRPAYEIEKHKIFLYKEDFQSFREALDEVINYVAEHVSEPIEPRPAYVPRQNDETEPEAEAAHADQPQAEQTEKTEDEEKESKGFFGKLFG
ncbi:MAG: DUF3276 family protein [Paludibacteraceae bacterium]|nr:DUF3276 family protein [Paludibacteraceae bacterium]